LGAVLQSPIATHGVITRADLEQLGFSSTAIHNLLVDGLLLPLHDAVYAVAGAEPTWQHRLRAACLVGGHGVASHRAGLCLWGCSWMDPSILEISVPRPKGPNPTGVIRHRVRDLAPKWVTEHNGIPVTTVDRTLVDLSAVVGPIALERALEEALLKRLTTVPQLWLALERLAKRGRTGVRQFRAVLGARALGDDLPESMLESIFAAILARAAVPQPVFQHRISVGGRWRRLDFAYPDLKIAIEVDGFSVHSQRHVFEDDRRRQNDLELAGWLVLRFTFRDLREQPEKVASQVRAALRSRRH
jgi:very-short-patch-repair endonuclease